MTRKLYHENQYLQTFSSAAVEQINVQGQPGIILEQTAFYPTSGGQPHDTGTLNAIAVLDVIEDEEHRIIHLLEKPISEFSITGQIDWERRFDHMQQHTGQHLLSQALLKTCEAETVSFHLGETSSTIDVNQPGLTAEAIRSAEHLANQIIYENREVLTHVVSSDELHRFPVRKPPTVEQNIRILEIKDFDYSPCGGTHCSRTGEIGLIKIAKTEHYKGGTRMHFLCGWRAIADYQHKAAILQQLTDAASAGEADLPQQVQKFQDENKALRKQQVVLLTQLLEYEAKTFVEQRQPSETVAIITHIFEDRPPKELKVLATKILEATAQTVVLFGSRNEGKAVLLFQRSEDLSCHMGQAMKAACAIIQGRGGGQPHQAQGGGPSHKHLAEALEQARDLILAESTTHP